jgi:TRAP-type C4-dicarboxylate transport system substrate-binding protein
MGDPTMFIVNPKVWESFSPEDRDLIFKAAKEAATYQIALARVGIDENDGGKSLEYLKNIGKAPEIIDWNAELQKVGMVVTNLTPEETQKFVDLTKPLVETWRKTIGEELVAAAEADMAAAVNTPK